MIEIDSRCDFPVLFKELGNIKTGIELGVSHGDYAKFLLDNYDSWDMLYGVDEYVEKWGGARDPRGIRDEKCYAKVKELLSPYPYTLMKTTFKSCCMWLSSRKMTLSIPILATLRPLMRMT